MRSDIVAKGLVRENAVSVRPRPAGDPAVALETRNAGGMPLEIAFLAFYGVPPAQLIAASNLARKEGVSADRALIGHGIVEERFFYQCLARHIGVSFIDEPVQLLDLGDTYQQAVKAGLVPFSGAAGLAWLGAPRGDSLITLIRNARRGGGLASKLAMTTPTLLSRWVQDGAHRRIAADASFKLLSADADLCAYGGLNGPQLLCALGICAVFAFSFTVPALSAAHVGPLMVGLPFLAAVIFRLCVSATALDVVYPHIEPLKDHQLPTYTILVALYKEARIVKRLVKMLNRIDYPRAKLEIKLIIEDDDDETRLALEALSLGPAYEVIFAPTGQPRTKPRALNVAVPLVRGELVAVFDAEDAPDPQQLRRAAAYFAVAPLQLACLQARLAIDNMSDSWLTRGIMAQTPQAIPMVITI